MENPKQQIIEHLKKANNVLVTVSKDPTVDQLAGAIGISLLLTKLGKHAAAVFSGQVPSIIEFLHPENTIEKTTDSLRDFIISLDKSKADKLRYKVEDEHVKIFITPYRSSITQDDLDFSQGDFNVDVILALGVRSQADIDQAIMAHGRILHDATIITIDLEQGSELTGINWTDTRASSLCEMLTTIADDLKKDVLDTQIANALLTGIVAETARFSNQKTSATTMTASARLLAAGADQQLVSEQLQPKPEPQPEPAPAQIQESAPVADDAESSEDGTTTFEDLLAAAHISDSADEQPVTEGEQSASDFVPELNEEPAAEPEAPHDDSALIVSHDDAMVEDDADAPVAEPTDNESSDDDESILNQIHINEQGELLPSQPAMGEVLPSQPALGDRLPDQGDESFLASLARQSDLPVSENGPPSLGHKLLSHNSGPASEATTDAAPAPEVSGPAPEEQGVAPAQAVATSNDPIDAIQAIQAGDASAPVIPAAPEAAQPQTLSDIEQSLFSTHAMQPEGVNAAPLPGAVPGPNVAMPAGFGLAGGVHSDDETIVAPTNASAAPAVPPPMIPNMSLPPVQPVAPTSGIPVMPPAPPVNPYDPNNLPR